MLISPLLKLHWPPQRVELLSARAADFVCLLVCFRYVVNRTGNSLQLGRWIATVLSTVRDSYEPLHFYAFIYFYELFHFRSPWIPASGWRCASGRPCGDSLSCLNVLVSGGDLLGLVGTWWCLKGFTCLLPLFFTRGEYVVSGRGRYVISDDICALHCLGVFIVL